MIGFLVGFVGFLLLAIAVLRRFFASPTDSE
jgi:hypothetical protein